MAILVKKIGITLCWLAALVWLVTYARTMHRAAMQPRVFVDTQNQSLPEVPNGYYSLGLDARFKLDVVSAMVYFRTGPCPKPYACGCMAKTGPSRGTARQSGQKPSTFFDSLTA